MKRILNSILIILVAIGLQMGAVPALAKQPKYIFKTASLAPEGSVWTKRFRDFAAEVEEKSNGEIGFKIYAGGVMGDDRSMYRKMKIGQLHGGGFTMTGISEVVPDFRVMGIPFFFKSYEEVDYVWAALWPRLKKEFAASDMELLAISEVGFIYTVSSKPITTMQELRNSKAWTPEGDPISKVFLETAGVSPIPLSIPDVLTSLQTGLIDTAFNSFYGSIILQWFTRIRYITDIPFVYGYGAILFDRKTFSRLPPEYAALMEQSAQKHFGMLLADTRQSNMEALQVLRENNITVVNATPETEKEIESYREKAVAKLVGSAFSRDIYEEALAALTSFRKEHASPPARETDAGKTPPDHETDR